MVGLPLGHRGAQANRGSASSSTVDGSVQLARLAQAFEFDKKNGVVGEGTYG